MSTSVFRKESIDRVSSPEQLNDYIKVSNVSIWIIIGAAIVLLVCVLAWAILGSLNTTVTTTAVTVGGESVCYVAQVDEIQPGCEVEFADGTVGTVESVSALPLSESEVSAKYADEYTVYALGLSQWNYVVTLSAPDTADGVSPAEIVVGSISPISFIWD